tara:strand:- start:196 stop:615 length:420 start_codon:yes stop_codon:yes gene_type:complete
MNIQDQEKYQKAIFASARSEAVINRLIDKAITLLSDADQTKLKNAKAKKIESDKIKDKLIGPKKAIVKSCITVSDDGKLSIAMKKAKKNGIHVYNNGADGIKAYLQLENNVFLNFHITGRSATTVAKKVHLAEQLSDLI